MIRRKQERLFEFIIKGIKINYKILFHYIMNKLFKFIIYNNELRAHICARERGEKKL